MKVDEFVETLRKYRWQEPTEPFVIEFRNGKRLLIDDPAALAFVEGNAGFLTSTYELIQFSSADVRAIGPDSLGALVLE
jgi:hypothetical protein